MAAIAAVKAIHGPPRVPPLTVAAESAGLQGEVTALRSEVESLKSRLAALESAAKSS